MSETYLFLSFIQNGVYIATAAPKSLGEQIEPGTDATHFGAWVDTDAGIVAAVRIGSEMAETYFARLDSESNERRIAALRAASPLYRDPSTVTKGDA